MKIDLDELEQKAQAAPGWSEYGDTDALRLYAVVVATRDPANVSHIEANCPPITLALIARIRELEATLRDSREKLRDAGDRADAELIVLERGVVLP